jgi:dinuclear metal center YbgI/SA1388 family protein
VNAPRLSRIVEIAEKLFPFDAAEAWDNSGIQIGNPDRSITAIAFSLDPTSKTLKFARDHSCQLLITHHPVLTEPVLNILPNRLPGKTLLAAAGMGIDILSLHTNLDAAPGGLNDRLAHVLGLQEVFTPVPAMCARMGQLPAPVGIKDLAEKISQKLEISHLRIISATEREVQRVFCASGSGMGYLVNALNYEADVMVTGDVRYHAALEALELGMPVIDAGHYGLEKAAVAILQESFQTEFERERLEVKCIACNIEQDPFVEICRQRGGFSLERTDSTAGTTSGDR